MAHSQVTDDNLLTNVKEEEDNYESTEEDQPSDADLEKWANLINKSKKYHILKFEGMGEGAIPKFPPPPAAPGPSKSVNSPVSIQVPQQLRLATFSGEEPTPKGEAIMQQFYTESQKSGESAAVWACRIEDILNPEATEFIPNEGTESMSVSESSVLNQSGTPDGLANISGGPVDSTESHAIPRRSGRQRKTPSWFRGDDWRK